MSNYNIGNQISSGVIWKSFWAKTKDGTKEFMAKVYYLTEVLDEETNQ
eukprot:CAMPEP_0114584172 /NCGR_PEP_ID=MMETSP0125-20121206/7893_1 /TAXON_ID=485358 ORGANISM="Aristerostoma sp., Strain ATCC 50986" /NCGR_SAMPLE_ID=MMETSP0125 /ASSEMBLY_ACC=CAM_ASM_000245 /LENGTH=47 /DNA_ID= /DNA_START= /DNA_END= /DNA_ORIENTATION=